MKNIIHKKKKNKFIFFNCSYISLFSYKIFRTLKKFSIYCSNKAENITQIEKEKVLEEIEKKVEVGEKIIKNKEKIIEHYKSLYKTIEECEKDSKFLANALMKSYILYKNQEFDELNKFYKEIQMEMYIK